VLSRTVRDEENGAGAKRAFLGNIQQFPGLTSWGILSRPLRQAQGRLYGTSHIMSWFPGLASWATFSRPFGTGPDTPDSCIDVKENRVELVDRLAAFASLRYPGFPVQLSGVGELCAAF
jgi:hypothetical protein